MRTRSSSNLIVESSTILKRRNRRCSKQIVKPELRTIVETPVATIADTRTMSELLQAPTEGYEDAIVIPAILAENFELKITSTLKYKNVPHDAIKLMIFPFSLEGAARIWLEKEPPRSILTWEDLVSKFVNYFFPPSKTTNLKNDITNFQQKFDETFSEAWDRFKELLRKCPHHGFSELYQIDTFYSALTQSDQDSLNAAADGNLLNRTPQDALTIIKNKSKVHTSRNKPIVSKVSTTTSSSSPSSDITALTDIVKELVLMNKANQQAFVKAVEDTCVTCGGPHLYYECLATDSNTFNAYAATGTYNQGGDLKVITTRSSVGYDGPTILPTPSPLPKEVERETEATKDKVQTTSSESTVHIHPPVVQVLIPMPEVAPKLHFDLSFADSLLHMPKFASTFMSLLSNKEKLFELASTPLNENCSAVLLKKLPEKLGDPGKFLIPFDYDVDPRVPLIIGRPFLRTERALIDVHVNVIDVACEEYAQEVLGFSDSSTSGNPTPSDPIIASSSPSFTPFEGGDFILEDIEAYLSSDLIPSGIDDADFDPEGDIRLLEKLLNNDSSSPLPLKELNVEELKTIKSSIDDPPELELKDLPSHLEYAFLEGTDKLPVIISKELKDEEKAALLKVLKSHKRAIAWKISDIKGIDPRFCTHKILMEDDFKPAVQHQRRVNPKIHEVIKKEVIKLLDAGLIYPISDSPWVSPVHCVPKKGGMTVVENEDNELIPTRLVTGWRVCIDYRKLNDATRKDHFPLPFMDQMLERLAGNEYYCFLDGFSGYFQIPIDPQDQEKTTFTCPYGTFAYRRMPFSLCNAPGTFQRCMMVIFHDMIEETMEVFMDDFSVFRDSFSSCLSHLDKMLKWCEDTNLVLNWEKRHFMVKEGIVLGHKIS
ncbi:reverse transcriptase domain-containing protein [Tanacetum coccineum]